MNQVLEYRSTSLGFVGSCEWVALRDMTSRNQWVWRWAWCCLQKKLRSKKTWEYCYHTVNGRNLAPVDMEHIHTYPIFLQGLGYIQQVVGNGIFWTIRIFSLSYGLNLSPFRFGFSQNLRCFVEWNLKVWEVKKHHSLIYGNMGLFKKACLKPIFTGKSSQIFDLDGFLWRIYWFSSVFEVCTQWIEFEWRFCRGCAIWQDGKQGMAWFYMVIKVENSCEIICDMGWSWKK